MLSSNAILGFWSRETVYLDGVNSNEYVDFLNGGTNFLHIKRTKPLHGLMTMGAGICQARP